MKAGLRRVLADNPSPMTLHGTYTYVVGHRRPVVIDPGPPLESHVRRVLDLLGGETPLAIVLTHAHPDHAGAAEALARATGAPVWLGAGAASGARLPRIDRLATRGDHLETDAGILEILPTPGHAPEHICIHWIAEDRRALFAGDMFLGHGDTTLIAAPEGSVADYLRSLDVVEELRPDVIYPAHGEPLDDYRDVVDRYRRHRHERIEQVRRALAEWLAVEEAQDLRVPSSFRAIEESGPGAVGPGSEGSMRWGRWADKLLDEVYGRSLDPRLRPAALASLQAILDYLGAAPTSR